MNYQDWYLGRPSIINQIFEVIPAVSGLVLSLEIEGQNDKFSEKITMVGTPQLNNYTLGELTEIAKKKRELVGNMTEIYINEEDLKEIEKWEVIDKGLRPSGDYRMSGPLYSGGLKNGF